MNEIKPKKHYCFNCGAETDNDASLPNGRTIYVCGDRECEKEHIYSCKVVESEAREEAEQDRYSKYY